MTCEWILHYSLYHCFTTHQFNVQHTPTCIQRQYACFFPKALWHFIIFSPNYIVPLGILPWKIWVALPMGSQMRQSRAIKPTVYTGCFSVFILHWTLTWTTRSLPYAQKRHIKLVCTESWLWKENPLPHRGIEPVSVAWRSDTPIPNTDLFSKER